MTNLFITLHLMGMRLMAPIDRTLRDPLVNTLDNAHATLRRARRDERGSVTIEQVIWAVALIALAGGVVAAITTYVNTKKAQIK